MQIGLDFDNTIACYDQAISLLAETLFELPAGLPRNKVALRNFLVNEGREGEWTAFQGELYGPGMRFAVPFKGAIGTMLHLVGQGHELSIVSHRTRKPYAGLQHDLHQAAKDWITRHIQSEGLFGGDNSSINFLETSEEKVTRISELGCQAFVDDLPEVLRAKNFPQSAMQILFDPSGSHKLSTGFHRITCWPELIKLLDDKA